jgi:YegS/Rv2252/BmrU family lipid kinase
MGVGTKTAIVLNPAGGHGRAGKRWPGLEPLVREALGDITVLRTEAPGHATELAREAVHSEHDRIVSVGGDGTLHEVVNGLFLDGQTVNPNLTLAMLPMGTGSDVARSLGISRNAAQALPVIVRGRTIQTDIGRARCVSMDGQSVERYFVSIADFGMGGEVAMRVNTASKFMGGFLSFLWGTVSTLLRYRNQSMRLTVDGKPLEGRYRSVIVANAAYFGGGMHVAPDARMDDGIFSVYAIGDVNFLEALVKLPKIYLGTIRNDRQTEYFEARKVEAESDERVLIDLDGEVPGTLPLTIDVLPGALRLVTGP